MKEFITHHRIGTEKELDILCRFLRANQLPADDLTLKNSLYLGYFNSSEELVGSGGLEFYGDTTLLRSLAVNPALRSQSLGKQIVEDLIEQVKALHGKQIYLLTTTALYFFLKLGFREITRDEVPTAIRASTQFSQGCPSSARVMRLIL